MNRRGAALLLVIAGIAVVVALYVDWKPAPEPGSRAWQIQEFRKDWEDCSQFASKREEARKLLAWRPKPPWVHPPGSAGWEKEFEARMQQDFTESEAKLKNADAEIEAMAARHADDELACLRDLDWQDVQIESLKKEVREADKKKLRRWPGLPAMQ